MDVNLSTPEENMRYLAELGLERWLKARRDEISRTVDPQAWTAIDILLDEVREAGAEGFLPWEREL